MHDRFWALADELVAASEIVVDRPKGSRHPRMPSLVYPLDYGYLAGTTGGDGAGVDVWRGSLPEQRVTGAIVTVDVLKRDAEVKLLIGCTPDEAQLALMTHDQPSQAAFFVPRSESVGVRVAQLNPTNRSRWEESNEQESVRPGACGAGNGPGLAGGSRPQ